MKIPQPISLSSTTTCGRSPINCANSIAKQTCKTIISSAPATNQRAARFPSLILTLAAVILINPGGKIPISALMNPKNNAEIIVI